MNINNITLYYFIIIVIIKKNKTNIEINSNYNLLLHNFSCFFFKNLNFKKETRT
jgi:hypothetical protein